MLAGLLKRFVGDKNQKDKKEYQPYVDSINVQFDKLSGLSDDDIRNKSNGFREIIKEGLKSIEDEKIALQKQVDDDSKMDVHVKEDIYEQIDKLTKDSDEKLEEILLEILPEAFAVVKETARRWAENGKMEVVATEMDKEIAARRDGVEISGDKAIWHNKWSRRWSGFSS